LFFQIKQKNINAMQSTNFNMTNFLSGKKSTASVEGELERIQTSPGGARGLYDMLKGAPGAEKLLSQNNLGDINPSFVKLLGRANPEMLKSLSGSGGIGLLKTLSSAYSDGSIDIKNLADVATDERGQEILKEMRLQYNAGGGMQAVSPEKLLEFINTIKVSKLAGSLDPLKKILHMAAAGNVSHASLMKQLGT